MSKKVRILGGGVIGLTTGIILNIRGYETEITTEEIPMSSRDYEDKSGIATEYAIAGVLPFAVDSNNVDISKILNNSSKIFDKFVDCSDLVMSNKHFHGADEDFNDPEFSDVLDGYTRIESSNVDFPYSEFINDVSTFNIQFVDMSKYVPQLLGLYEETGGIIRKGKVSNPCSIEEDIVFNCTGYGSKELFDDDRLSPVRGHLGYVKTDRMVENNKYGVFSYTYDVDGVHIYAYSQDDRIVIGSSQIHPEYFDEEPDNFFNPDSGEKIPEYIINKNRELIINETGMDILDYDIHGVSGYRPYRDGGIRIEIEEIGDRFFVHNYGHGGCGVTLSWGSAIEAFSLINNQVNRDKLCSEVRQLVNEYIPIF